jgi:endoglucanase
MRTWLFLVAVGLSQCFAADGDPVDLPPPPVTPGVEYRAPFPPAYNYAEVLHKSFLFYRAQQSGTIPVRRLAWRSHSCLSCKGAYGEDLSRGFYEAAVRLHQTLIMDCVSLPLFLFF